MLCPDVVPTFLAFDSGDKSHKITKLVFTRLSADDAKLTSAFDGCFTLYNSRRQVVCQILVRTSSPNEVRKALEGVARRFRELGFEGPLLYSTDDCCHEEQMLSEVFATLRAHRISVALEGNFAPLVLPSYDRTSTYLTSQDKVMLAIGELQTLVNDATLSFVGLDAEWVPGESTAYGVDTLQISTTDGLAILIPRPLLVNPPDCLRNFLLDRKVAKVGRNIGPDVKRLVLGHGLDVNNVIDVGSRAKELKVVSRVNVSLDSLVRLLLKKALAGKGSTQLSRWDAAQLSDDQVVYALIDAYASALVYQQLIALEDADKIPSRTALSPGTILRLYNRGNSRVAAVANITDDVRDFEGVALGEDDVVVKLTHIIIPSTRLASGEGTLSQRGLNSKVVWKRQRTRLLPPSWSISENQQLLGRTWTDPIDHVTFRIVGFSYGNDGLRVDYVDNAQEDEEDEEPAWKTSSKRILQSR